MASAKESSTGALNYDAVNGMPWPYLQLQQLRVGPLAVSFAAVVEHAPADANTLLAERTLEVLYVRMLCDRMR